MLTRTRRRTPDPVVLARRMVAAGCAVAVEGLPAGEVVDRLVAAGLAQHCELTLDVERMGPARVRSLALGAGLAVAVSGPAAEVDGLADALPDVRVVVPAREPRAEARCRALAGRRVRLVRGSPIRGGHATDLVFVRCLDVLMAGNCHAAVAATDPRLIAIAGERAAWHGRAPDSWEYVVPYGTRTEQRQRLVAAGCSVRVAVRPGRGRA